MKAFLRGHLVRLSIRNISDRLHWKTVWSNCTTKIQVDFRSCSWHLSKWSWFCWKMNSCYFNCFILVSCCNTAWPPMWTVGLSSWPWKSGDIGWTGLKMHSWFGQIIATWSTSNKPNIDSLLGSMGSFLWPVWFHFLLLSRHQEETSCFLQTIPFTMHLWGNCMSYSCWLHRQNKLRSVYNVVYCFLCIKKARLHIAYLSSMKNTTVIQTENKASNAHSPSLKQSMTLV